MYLEIVFQRWYNIKNYLKTLQNYLQFTYIVEIDTIFQPHIDKNKY